MRTVIINKNILSLLLLLVMAIGLPACEQDDSRSRISGARGTRTTGDGRLQTTAGTSAQQSGVGFTGIIWAGANVSQQEFQYRLDNFMSVSFDPLQNIGLVSGSIQGDTGVRLMAVTRAEMTDGSIISAASTGTIRSGTGNFRILVWDDIAKTSGQGFQIEFGMASGSIQNGRITMVLSDTYGALNVVGQISNGYFQGVIDYDNTQYWDGEKPGAANRLGEFYIPVCDYFRCQ